MSIKQDIKEVFEDDVKTKLNQQTTNLTETKNKRKFNYCNNYLKLLIFKFFSNMVKIRQFNCFNSTKHRSGPYNAIC